MESFICQAEAFIPGEGSFGSLAFTVGSTHEVRPREYPVTRFGTDSQDEKEKGEMDLRPSSRPKAHPEMILILMFMYILHDPRDLYK